MESMKRLFILLLLGLVVSVSLPTHAQSEEYDFMKPYNELKSKLRKIPEKKIEKTLFCSQMNLLVDRAVPANRNLGDLKADRIVVSKTRRKLYLFSKGELISEYSVAFGFGSLEGPKSRMGDGRTPEGLYRIKGKNPGSNYYRSLHVSYPNQEDQKFADKHKVKPGGSIMIHGYPNKAIDGLDPVLIPQIHPRVDWTQGCIAVSNDEIQEIYDYTDKNVVVEICPLEENVSQ